MVAGILVIKIISAASSSKESMVSSLLFAFLLCGLVGVGITATVRGVNAYRDKKSQKDNNPISGQMAVSPPGQTSSVNEPPSAPIAASAHPTQTKAPELFGDDGDPQKEAAIYKSLEKRYKKLHPELALDSHVVPGIVPIEAVSWINEQLRKKGYHFHLYTKNWLAEDTPAGIRIGDGGTLFVIGGNISNNPQGVVGGDNSKVFVEGTNITGTGNATGTGNVQKRYIRLPQTP